MLAVTFSVVNIVSMRGQEAFSAEHGWLDVRKEIQPVKVWYSLLCFPQEVAG